MRDILSRITKLSCITLSLFALASCRLVLQTGGDGRILSHSGQYDCHQSTCAYTVEDELRDTFTAIPAEGYRFAGWEGICTTAPTETCSAVVVALPEEMSEFDGDAPLVAIFEPNTEKRAWYRDSDGDNFGTALESRMAYERPEGFALLDSDCDDSNANVHPWRREQPDGLDNNCNGKVDERTSNARFYLDHDSDGFGDPGASVTGRRKPRGYVANNLDCDDTSAAINPAAGEILDSIDNDCDGNIDNPLTTLFRDVDGDGYGGSEWFIETHGPLEGYVENDSDCDDENDAIYPGASEVLDSVDNNCDGEVDEGLNTQVFYLDVDGDAIGDSGQAVQAIERPSGYARIAGDNCPDTYNPNQGDSDGDGIGDACDDVADRDRDGIDDALDNCPGVYNPSQSDSDGDGLGNSCDSVDNTAGGGDTGGSSGSGGDVCSMTSEDQAMLDAVNAFRSSPQSCGSRGSFAAAPALSWSCALETAALRHSTDMASNNFFDHTGSDGSDPGQRIAGAGYSFSTWGENVAAGVTTVNGAMGLWINSAGHCANLMNPAFRDLGAAKASSSGSTYGTYWTQVFARP